MALPTLTLDTSAVIAASDESSAAAELFRRARAGDFDLAVCNRVDFQLKRPIEDPDLAAFVAGLPRLLSVGRWADPDNDELPIDTWGNFVWAGQPEPRPELSVGSRLDDDHLDAHKRSGRDHFVTLDDGQLRHGRRLGLDTLTPADVLARYPASVCEDPPSSRSPSS